MNTKSFLGFIAVLALTLGRFQMAIADTQTVPVNELKLVEESEVACPICEEAKENGEEVAKDDATDDHHGHGGHGHYGHQGGHGHHGHGGHSHWYDNNDSKSDSSQLPQPSVELN